jgi:hypothetical protein
MADFVMVRLFQAKTHVPAARPWASPPPAGEYQIGVRSMADFVMVRLFQARALCRPVEFFSKFC